MADDPRWRETIAGDPQRIPRAGRECITLDSARYAREIRRGGARLSRYGLKAFNRRRSEVNRRRFATRDDHLSPCNALVVGDLLYLRYGRVATRKSTGPLKIRGIARREMTA